MTSRRHFVKAGISLLAAHAVAPSLHGMLSTSPAADGLSQASTKLRVAFASDGHYGQPGTPSDDTHADIIKWINQEHQVNKIDFVVFNGDIVHDQPALLKVVRDKYFGQLQMPYYALPGNHDHATAAVWKDCFGYDMNYSIERDDIAFVLANTSNEKGEYVCPDIRFLETEFEKFKSKALVFVVLHIPPYQWLKEETYFTHCEEVVALMHRYKNIKAVFHGHDHTLDGVRYTSGLPHFFDGHYGGNWGTAYRGFRILEIGTDNSLVTFQKNPGLQPVLNKNSF